MLQFGGKRRAKELGLTAEAGWVPLNLPTGRYEALAASMPVQRFIFSQGWLPLQGETLTVQLTAAVKES